MHCELKIMSIVISSLKLDKSCKTETPSLSASCIRVKYIKDLLNYFLSFNHKYVEPKGTAQNHCAGAGLATN